MPLLAVLLAIHGAAPCAAEREGVIGREFLKGGPGGFKRLRILLVSDGFTEAQLTGKASVPSTSSTSSTPATSSTSSTASTTPTSEVNLDYKKYCSDMNTRFFQLEPFKSYENLFTVERVDVASLPGQAYLGANPGAVYEYEQFRDRAEAMRKLEDIYAGETPNATFIVANKFIGDAGCAGVITLLGPMLTPDRKNVDVGWAQYTYAHELGHGLCGLADEYEGNRSLSEKRGIIAVAPNIAFASDEPVKWQHWIDWPGNQPNAFAGEFRVFNQSYNSGLGSSPEDKKKVERDENNVKGVIGRYDGGAEVPLGSGVIKPRKTCWMANSPSVPFCEVCREGSVRFWFEILNLFDFVSPPNGDTVVAERGNARPFIVKSPLTADVETDWLLNNVSINDLVTRSSSGGGTEWRFDPDVGALLDKQRLNSTNNTLMVLLRDTKFTKAWKTEGPQAAYGAGRPMPMPSRITWQIQVREPLLGRTDGR
jgi:hypothetical protein